MRRPGSSQRPAIALAIALAGCGLIAPSIAGAWEHNAVLWNISSSPIPVELHETTVDGITLEELEGIVQASIATWNDVPCLGIELEYIGTTPMSVAIDDRQIFEWISDEERWVYGSMAAGANIASVFDPPETPEHEDPMVDIAFNAVNFGWAIGGGGLDDTSVLDPQSVFTHELGHFLGLAHSRLSNVETMSPAYIPDTSQRSLSFDDKSGICEKYWVEEDECATADDCPEGQPCEAYASEENGGAVMLCAEQHGAFGDPCSGTDLNCVGICLFTSANFESGICSARCESDADCPCDWSCRNLQTEENPFLVCRDIPPDDGETCDEGGDSPDAGMDVPPDVVEDTSEGDQDADTIDAPTQDADPDPVDTVDDDTDQPRPPMMEKEDEGCDCATTRGGSPDPTPLSIGLAVGALIFFKKRRR